MQNFFYLILLKSKDSIVAKTMDSEIRQIQILHLQTM